MATSALGMGFDKPDLGFVVHFQRPGSVVHYYCRQVGRAGRAMAAAYGVLLSGREDEDISDYFIRTAFPPEAHTRDVLAALHKAEDGLGVVGLEGCLNLPAAPDRKGVKSPGRGDAGAHWIGEVGHPDGDESLLGGIEIALGIQNVQVDIDPLVITALESL